MIKKYNIFLNESKYQEIESEYHSIGEYIEEVSKDDEYIRNIISNYINDIDTDIRISNAINILEDFDKKQVFYRVYNYLKHGEVDKDIVVSTSILSESTEIMAGRNVFISFLKSITALGHKGISRSTETHNGFLLYYDIKNIEVKLLKSILNRFKSLNTFEGLIEYIHNDCSLYYGIKYDTIFEYGFVTDTKIPIGQFKLNKSNIDWLMLLQSPSANSLKKDIVGLNLQSLTIFCKIASEMVNYDIKAQSKTGPIIKDDVITFGYHGVGRWDNGKLDDNDYINLKTNFKNWLSKYKWSQNILVSVSYNSFWVYFNLKLK